MPQLSDRHTPVRLLINGARGRMGALLVRLASEDSRFIIAAQRDVQDRDAAADVARDLAVDVVIDFSSDAGVRDACRLARHHRAALLVGSTGLAPETLAMLDDAARSLALLHAANTSLGVAVLAHLAHEAARLLGGDAGGDVGGDVAGGGFDIDIIETHHTMKKDAPSGTALRLARAIEGGLGAPLPPQRIHAIRTGDVIGEHTIHFAGPGERLTLTHSATNRELFARGALRAALFLAGKPPGRYTIEQALGITEPSKRRNER